VTCVAQEDADQRPFVSRVINRLANYDGGIIQNTEQDPVDEPGEATDASTATPGSKKKKKKKAPAKKVKHISAIGAGILMYGPKVSRLS